MDNILNLSPQENPKSKYELVELKNQELTYMGSMKLKRGHKLFSCRLSDGWVEEVKIEKSVTLGMDGQPIKRHKVTQEKGHIYVGALNEKNAIKKFENQLKKWYNQSKQNA